MHKTTVNRYCGTVTGPRENEVSPAIAPAWSWSHRVRRQKLGFQEAKTTRMCRYNTGKGVQRGRREGRKKRKRKGRREGVGGELALEICIKLPLSLWLSINLYKHESKFLENTRLNSTRSSNRVGGNLGFHQQEQGDPVIPRAVGRVLRGVRS